MTAVMRCAGCDAHNDEPRSERRNPEVMPALGSRPSLTLSANTPDYIRQDIGEAEEAHFYQLYKSSAVMCRRALQLGIEIQPNAPQGKTLGPLLAWARGLTPPLFSPATYALAEGIKDIGDAGAHRVEHIPPDTVAMVINITVTALNELFPA